MTVKSIQQKLKNINLPRVLSNMSMTVKSIQQKLKTDWEVFFFWEKMTTVNKY